MTVRELIEELKKYPQDIPATIECSYDCGACLAGGDIQGISLDADARELIIYNLYG